MAASSSSVTGNSLSRDVMEKLTPDNFLVWKVVVLPAVCSASLCGYVDGSVKAPAEKIIVEKLVDGKTVQEEEENALLRGMDREGSAGSGLSPQLDLPRGLDIAHRASDSS
jgi:hypothetical protein